VSPAGRGTATELSLLSIEDEALALGLGEEDIEAYRHWKEQLKASMQGGRGGGGGGGTVESGATPTKEDLPLFLKKKLKKRKDPKASPPRGGEGDDPESPTGGHVPW